MAEKRTILPVLGLSLFLFMLFHVLADKPVPWFDVQISQYMAALQTESMTKWVIFITDLGGVVASSIVFAVAGLFFWYKKWYSDLKFWLLAFGGATLLFNMFKFSIQRARPELRLIQELTYSFPSGHTTTATAIALAFYFIFVKRVGEGWPHALLLLVCMLWPLVIAATRLYLNVHWFSDVTAGWSLGIFWVTLMAMLYCSDDKGKGNIIRER